MFLVMLTGQTDSSYFNYVSSVFEGLKCEGAKSYAVFRCVN